MNNIPTAVPSRSSLTYLLSAARQTGPRLILPILTPSAILDQYRDGERNLSVFLSRGLTRVIFMLFKSWARSFSPLLDNFPPLGGAPDHTAKVEGGEGEGQIEEEEPLQTFLKNTLNSNVLNMRHTQLH